MRKPSVTVRRDTKHNLPQEKIVEVCFPDGSGALVSVRVNADGQNVIEVYRKDTAVLVWSDIRSASETLSD